MRRFEYESQVLAHLQHPGIAQVYEVGTLSDGAGAADLPFFAMDGQVPFDLPFSYVGGGLATIERRLELFPIVEIACVETKPFADLPFTTLLEQKVILNPGFTKL